ncbi:MAG TPA: hypothetical protein DD670_19870 [Planctomycetaceae bacterium]|nr:hypothetical protein [Planctomycetaceae bacterium]
MPEFIAGGAAAYEKGLRQEYESARARLEARLKECADPSQRHAIEEELRDLKEDFKSRLRRMRHSLFGTG